MAHSQVWKQDRLPRSLWSSGPADPPVAAQEKRQFFGYRPRLGTAKVLVEDASRRPHLQLKACISRAHIALYRGAVCIASSVHEENVQKLRSAWNDALSDLDQAQVLVEQNAQFSELISHLRRHVKELILMIDRQPMSDLEGVSAHSTALFIMDSIECLGILVEQMSEHLKVAPPHRPVASQ